MDLIDRQAAIDVVAQGLSHTFVENRDVAEKMLAQVPTIAAVPIGIEYKTATKDCGWSYYHSVEEVDGEVIGFQWIGDNWWEKENKQ